MYLVIGLYWTFVASSCIFVGLMSIVHVPSKLTEQYAVAHANNKCVLDRVLPCSMHN